MTQFVSILLFATFTLGIGQMGGDRLRDQDRLRDTTGTNCPCSSTSITPCTSPNGGK